jgi:hypothetical protein
MAADADRNISDRKQELLHEELTKFTDSFYKRSNGSKTAVSWI